MIPGEGDALELNRLAGPINGAVREKHHRLLWLGLLHGAAPVIVSTGRADLPSVVLHEEKSLILVFGFLKTENSRLVRGTCFFDVFAAVIPQPGVHLRTGDRLAGVALHDETLEPVRPRADHQPQIADPNG